MKIKEVESVISILSKFADRDNWCHDTDKGVIEWEGLLGLNNDEDWLIPWAYAQSALDELKKVSEYFESIESIVSYNLKSYKRLIQTVVQSV